MTQVIIAHIATLAVVFLALVSLDAMDKRPDYVVIMGAEDDCPFKYGGIKLRDAVGVTIDNNHAVECRY